MSADDLVAWGTLALAIGTGALAYAMFRLVGKNTQLVEEGQLARAQWTALAIETSRARLDTKAPATDLTVDAFSTRALDPTLSTGPDRHAHLAPANSRWTFPRDHLVELAVRVQFTLVNRAPRSVRMEVEGRDLIENGAVDGGTGPEEVYQSMTFTLESGKSMTVTLEARKTLQEWASDHTRRGRGRSQRGGRRLRARRRGERGHRRLDGGAPGR